MVGLSPLNAQEVHNLIGTHLRTFVDTRETVRHDQEWLAATDLKVDPYLMSAEDETLIKGAIADLDTTLESVDLTTIGQLTGLW